MREVSSNNRTIIIAGTTGLVGRAVLKAALQDQTIGAVHSLSRRPLKIEHVKLKEHLVDFDNLPELPQADELYLALGTTIKIAGSRPAFRAVDYGANLTVARAALAAGVQRIGLVSSMGADAQSSIFYLRVKGELESALLKLGFAGSVFVRPSLLVGDRRALGQPHRIGEQIGVFVTAFLGRLVPRRFRPVSASAVASALLAYVPSAEGNRVVISSELPDALQKGDTTDR